MYDNTIRFLTALIQEFNLSHKNFNVSRLINSYRDK